MKPLLLDNLPTAKETHAASRHTCRQAGYPVSSRQGEGFIRGFYAAHDFVVAFLQSGKECACPQHGKWIASEDVDRLVRELDVAWNGEHGAAPQAALCDIVGQIIHETTTLHGIRAGAAREVLLELKARHDREQ